MDEDDRPIEPSAAPIEPLPEPEPDTDTQAQVEADVGLAKLNQAERMLAEVQTMKDADHVASIAAAARVYAEREKLGLACVNWAVTIRMKAQIRMGELLHRAEDEGLIPRHGGDRGNQYTGGKQVRALLGKVAWVPNQRKAWDAKKLAALGMTDALIDKAAADATAAGQQLQNTLRKHRTKRDVDSRAVLLRGIRISLPSDVAHAFADDIVVICRHLGVGSGRDVLAAAVRRWADEIRSGAAPAQDVSESSEVLF